MKFTIKHGNDEKIVLVDDNDAQLVSGVTWRITDRGYVRGSTGGRREFLHRLIVAAMPGQLVDHINGDKLDNRRCNLRIATHAENMRNRRVSRSGVKGAKWKPRDRKWEASIKVNRRDIFLGHYQSKTEAMRAYDAAARFYHGPFARTNFPGEEAASADTLRARLPPASRSGYLGVYKDTRANSWRAQVKGVDGTLWRKSFADPVEAARERDRMALQIQGPDAKLNFPEDFCA